MPSYPQQAIRRLIDGVGSSGVGCEKGVGVGVGEVTGAEIIKVRVLLLAQQLNNPKN